MRTRSILALALGIPLVVVGVVLAVVLTSDGRKNIDLQDWVGRDDAWSRQMMPGARPATGELCGEKLPCVQAVTSQNLTMYRFASEDDAAAAARTFGADAHLSHWIVVRYEPGRLTAAQRQEFADDLDCVNVGIADDGREC